MARGYLNPGLQIVKHFTSSEAGKLSEIARHCLPSGRVQLTTKLVHREPRDDDKIPLICPTDQTDFAKSVSY